MTKSLIVKILLENISTMIGIPLLPVKIRVLFLHLEFWQMYWKLPKTGILSSKNLLFSQIFFSREKQFFSWEWYTYFLQVVVDMADLGEAETYGNCNLQWSSNDDNLFLRKQKENTSNNNFGRKFPQT